MFNVAIDGPAGAGKSSIARQVAQKLGFIYIDTGALYRTVGLNAVNNGVDLKDTSAIESSLDGLEVEIKFIDDEQRVYMNGTDVSDKIRTPEISLAASAVSSVPKVREFLFDLQKSLAESNNSIMDGRDIGTVVLPNADVKIFLTASAKARADRRYKQLEESGESVVWQDVYDDIVKRDYDDSHRAIAPLKQADDAVLADTSELTLEQSIELIEDIIKRNLK